ncbi:MAG TPA: IclR family transcriptional regulator [Limnochorda sp.]
MATTESGVPVKVVGVDRSKFWARLLPALRCYLRLPVVGFTGRLRTPPALSLPTARGNHANSTTGDCSGRRIDGQSEPDNHNADEERCSDIRDAIRVSSLTKGFRILRYLAEHGPSGVRPLSRATGLGLASTFRMLRTLCSLGVVEQTEDRRYRLGLAAVLLGQAAAAQRSILQLARPVMARLLEETGESVSLVLFERGQAFYVDNLQPERSIRIGPPRVGSTLPLHCTAAGKVYLASLSPEEARALLATLSLTARTPHTITDVGRLWEDIRATAIRGYAVDNQELEIGLVCVAAPVYDHLGRCVGALSLSGFSGRMEAMGLAAVAQRVRAFAAELSRQLGAPRAAPMSSERSLPPGTAPDAPAPGERHEDRVVASV